MPTTSNTDSGIAVWSSRLLCVFEIFHNEDIKSKMLICMGGFSDAQTPECRQVPRALTHSSLSAQEFSQTAGCVHMCIKETLNHHCGIQPRQLTRLSSHEQGSTKRGPALFELPERTFWKLDRGWVTEMVPEGRGCWEGKTPQKRWDAQHSFP